MKIKFGPNVCGETGKSEELIKNIKTSLNFSDEAVELALQDLSRVGNNREVNNLIKSFKYISIHMPVIKNNLFISYPDLSIETEISSIDEIIDAISPHTILFHPDLINDFEWVRSKYGSRLAFENMDSRKNFGKTVEDMINVFEMCPDAKFVLDVNHIYTNDKTMKLANDFYLAFKDRLTHYHLSGYGGFHDALCKTHEDIILKGIESFDYPIIHEGNLLQMNILKEEFEYISKLI